MPEACSTVPSFKPSRFATTAAPILFAVLNPDVPNNKNNQQHPKALLIAAMAKISNRNTCALAAIIPARAHLRPTAGCGASHVVFTLPAPIADIAYQKGGHLRHSAQACGRDPYYHRGRRQTPRPPDRHHRSATHLGLGLTHHPRHDPAGWRLLARGL